MREYDHPVVELRDGVGLELDANGSQLTGTIVKLEPAPIGLCWLCGRNDTAGGIARVAYRQGDWLFRAPEDPSSNDEVLRGASPESRDYILTLAYNRATGERSSPSRARASRRGPGCSPLAGSRSPPPLAWRRPRSKTFGRHG